ncbi:MAG: hypothetical protein OXC05_02805 [Halieaceae bacterium]|nr:hypothetical protein [Halieaceae bacterium]
MLDQSEPEALRIPGETGIWVFLLVICWSFTLFIATCLFYRAADLELFNASQQQRNQVYGIFYTVVLLSSSWLVATGVHAARLGRDKVPSAMFLLALACGANFIIVKIFEYSEKIRSGTAILVIAFLKVGFVSSEFMEARMAIFQVANGWLVPGSMRPVDLFVLENSLTAGPQ